MSIDIDPEKIAAKKLSKAEVKYLQDRMRLPADYFPADEVEPQASPTIEDKGGLDDEGGEEDYDEGWTNDQRRAELSSRNLSVDGNKAELISRLRRSDSDQLEEDDYTNLED